MPTVMTHAALGWAATRVGRRLGVRLDGRVALAAAALAVLPDLDVIGHWLGVPYRSPLGHRGLSHSLLFALATSSAACWLLRRSGSPVGIGVFAVLVVATSSHALLDMLSDAGLGCALASPLHDGRYFWPFRPLPTAPRGVPRRADARLLRQRRDRPPAGGEPPVHVYRGPGSRLRIGR